MTIPIPPEGASAAEIAAFAVDSGRITADLEDALAGILRNGTVSRAGVIADRPGKYDNSGNARTRDRVLARQMDGIRREIATTRAVSASQPRLSGPTYPGASEDLMARRAAQIGQRPGAVQASYRKPPPEAFPGGGDLPVATASGMDPRQLRMVPWPARWAIANEPSPAVAQNMLKEHAEWAAAFPAPTGMPDGVGWDGDAQAYLNDFKRFLSEA